MPSFLPSEIGRLIYGYLLTECNEDLAEEFLNSCDSLKECRMQRQLGRKFHATVQDLSLTGILNQYSVLSSIIFENATEGDCAHRNLLNLLQGLLKSRLGAVASYYESKSTCNTSTTSVVPETLQTPNPVARQTAEVGVQCSDVVTNSRQKRPNSSCDASVQCLNTSLNSLEKPFDSGYCDASTLTDTADISHVESTVTLSIANNDSLLLTSNSVSGSDDNLLKSSHHPPSRVQEQSDAENVPLVNDPRTADNLAQVNNHPPAKSEDRLSDADIAENVPQLNESLMTETISVSHVNQLPSGNVSQSKDHSQPIAKSCGSNSIATEAPCNNGDTAIDLNARVPVFDANLLNKPLNRSPMNIREPFTGSENFVITPSDKSRIVVNLRRTPLKVVEPNATSAKKTGNREAHKSPVFDNYHIIGSSYRTPAKTRPKPPPETELLKSRTPDLARIQKSAEKVQQPVEKPPSVVPWDFHLRQSLAEEALKAGASEAKSSVKCKKNRTPGKKRKADEASAVVSKKSKPEEAVGVRTETSSKSAKSEAVEEVNDSSKLRSHRKSNATIDSASPTEMCKKRIPKHIRKPDDGSKAADKKNERKRNEHKSRNDVPKARDVEDDTSQKSIDATIDDVIRGETDSKTVPAVNYTENQVLDKGRHQTSSNSVRNNSNKRSKHESKVPEHDEKRKENRSESASELSKSSSRSQKDVLCSTNSECPGQTSGSAVCHKNDTSVESAADKDTKNTDAVNGLKCDIIDDNHSWQSNLVKTPEFLLFHRDSR